MTRRSLRDLAEGADERRKVPGVPDDLTALSGYQRGLKRAAAEAAGLPFDAYFHLPYAEWAEIRDGR